MRQSVRCDWLGRLVPARETVRRSMLSVEVSWMLYYRKKHWLLSGCLYPQIDSSPQAGEDWLMTCLLWIQKDKVVDVLRAFHMLCNSGKRLQQAIQTGDAQSARDILLERARSSQEMSLWMKYRQLSPVAIGLKAASLEAKTRGSLHTLLLHSPKPHKETMLTVTGNVIGLTPDLGTESGIIDFQAQSWSDLMPSWMNLKKEAEAGLEVDVDDVGFSEDVWADFSEDVLPRVLESPSARPEAGEPTVQAPSNPGDQAEAKDAAAPSNPKKEEEEEEDDDDHHMQEAVKQLPFVFPNSLVVPGILHVLHNMVKSLVKSLPSFKKWLVGLKALVKLLCKGTGSQGELERFLATCVRDRPDRQFYEGKFVQAGVMDFPEWRWGKIIETLTNLLPLRIPLRACWAPSLFLNGADKDKARDDEEVANQKKTGSDELNMCGPWIDGTDHK